MNDVDELKRFIVAHARAQGIPRTQLQKLMGRINSDNGDGPGSWVGEWCQEGDRLQRQGRLFDACRYYMMAQFPYVNDIARQEALNKCLGSFDRFRRENTDIQRLDVVLDDGQVSCWTKGLSRTRPLPLLIIMGGIVSIKELWAYTLLGIGRSGMAGVVTEMPGTGENTLRYRPDSWRMISAILDAVGDQADVAKTYTITPSFAGHLALQCAVEDPRIQGVVSAGAPVNHFFTDTAWQEGIPRITIDTLAHMTGATPTRLSKHLQDWALTPEQLKSLTIPVHYMAALRDEVIPREDVSYLKEYVRRLCLVESDDVHGLPKHCKGARIWTARSIMRIVGSHNLTRAVLSAVWHGHRAWRKLVGARVFVKGA